jgi:hypothetical protein
MRLRCPLDRIECMEKLSKNSNGQWKLEDNSLTKSSIATKQSKGPLRTEDTVNTQAHQITAPQLDPKLGTRPESQIKLISDREKQIRSREPYSSIMGYGEKGLGGAFVPKYKGAEFGVDKIGRQVSLGTGWATKPSSQIHEGFHSLVDRIQQDHKKGGFDRPHRAAGVFLSALNDHIHPELKTLLHHDLVLRGYADESDKHNSKEQQAVKLLNEKVALVHDLMNSPDRRNKFFSDATEAGKFPAKGTQARFMARREFMNKLKSSMKNMQSFAKKATWDDLKAHKPAYEFTLAQHNILDK